MIKISVRNLVEFVLRSGDLDTRFFGGSRAVEGTKAHQKIQRFSGDEYEAEVSLKYEFEYKGFRFILQGRVDGIINKSEGICIDEIKSTTRPLDEIDENYNHIHWAQAKCYAYIYSVQNSITSIDIQLTYYNIDTEEMKKIVKTFTIEELEEFFYDLIDKYLVWAKYTYDWQIERDNSITRLEFPFRKYRKGQRKLAVAVYRTITEGKKLFAQAPTGIGKTMSTIFPSIKALGEGHTSKIFYLTAKTITRQVAEEAFIKMKEKGLKVKVLTITAKEKICFLDEPSCSPDGCEYAKGHFDRVNNALLDILTNESLITRELVEKYSKRHRVCPFEFSLDLAIWADCVICDYNYVFDPRVYLKRFFADNDGDYTFLVDEAHNLVDRSREMFSAEFFKKALLDTRKLLKNQNQNIYKALTKLNSYMLKIKKECKENNQYIMKEEPSEIYPLLRKLIGESEEWLTGNHNKPGHKELLELYFNAHGFTKIAENYDERYVTYIEKNNDDVKLKLFCLDPSYLLSEATKRGKTAIFFSATLTPLEYFREILGGSENDYLMRLASPFDRKNLCLMIANNVSTKYKDRKSTYQIVAEYIKEVVSYKRGNYLVFFPSYKYMNDVYKIFSENYPDINTIIQEPGMAENEREFFLERFNDSPFSNILGFAVMGGIFSEGIDLKGERLVGSIIVGVGLPQICLERDVIRDYFHNQIGKGFEYAYMYPGMNKVLQAAGRVIRSEKDKGVVLLVDERFGYSSYNSLFPLAWRHYKKVKSANDIKNNLLRFWDCN